MEYTAGEAARVVGISVASVRGYSARFAQFLSPTASPGPGKHRVLTDDDLRVMRFVFHFTAQGESWDNVAARLARGEVATFDWVPPAPALSDQAQAQETALAAVPALLGSFLQRLEDERRHDLDAARAREDELTRQLLDARERIGRLEGELAAVRTQTKTGEVSPRLSFWQRLRGRA